MDISVYSSMLSVTAKTEKRREGKKLRQYLAALSATIMPFGAGTVLGWTSPALGKGNELNVTAAEGSWIGAIIALGAVVGSLPASWGADIIGRKPMIALLAVPFILSWILLIIGKSVIMLLTARFIAGAVIGAITATIPMYIGEIAETSIRGELGSYIQLLLTIGILFVYAVGSLTSYLMMNIACCLVPVVFVILFLILAPESPTYLLRMNRRKDAERSLILLRGSEYDIYGELEEIQEQLDEEAKRKSSFRSLFSNRAVIRATIAVMGLLSFLSFSGINVLIFYAKPIFDKNGESSISSDMASVLVSVAQCIMTYLSGLIVDKAGRRILLLLSDSIMAICLLIIGAFFFVQENDIDTTDFNWVPLVSFCVYISVFSLGFGPIPGIMMGELFSPEAKGKALGIVCILASLLEFIVVKFFHNLTEIFQYGVTFWIFAGNCALGTLFVYFLVPETKNKSLAQIQDELNGIKRKKKKKKGTANSTSGKNATRNNSGTRSSKNKSNVVVVNENNSAGNLNMV